MLWLFASLIFGVFGPLQSPVATQPTTDVSAPDAFHPIAQPVSSAEKRLWSTVQRLRVRSEKESIDDLDELCLTLACADADRLWPQVKTLRLCTLAKEGRWSEAKIECDAFAGWPKDQSRSNLAADLLLTVTNPLCEMLPMRTDATSAATADDQLTSTLFAGHDPEDAERLFRDEYSLNPTGTAALIGLAHVREYFGDYNDAVALYLQALNIEPDNRDIHFSLAQSYVSQGQVKEGLAEYQKVLDRHPDDSNVYNNIGLVCVRQGDSTQAIEAYKKAIEVDPSMTAAYVNLANTEFQLGHFALAKDALQAALKIDSTNYITWLNAGVMATTVGDLGSGVKYFQAAIYYNPFSVDANCDLGMVLMRRNHQQYDKARNREALNYFSRAMELEPSNKHAKEQFKEALDEWKQHATTEPSS